MTGALVDVLSASADEVSGASGMRGTQRRRRAPGCVDERLAFASCAQRSGGGGGSRGDGREGGSFSDSVVNSALRYRAQAPLVDQLLREIGVDAGDVGKVARGLLDRTPTALPPTPSPKIPAEE